MNFENDKQKNKRLSELLSAVDRNASEPNYEFIDKLQKKSTAEFIASCAKEVKNTKTISSIWRIIMKSNITKIAAAAMIIIAVLIATHYLGGSIDGTSIAWADVLENIDIARTVTYTLEIQKNDVWGVYTIRIKEPYLLRSDTIESGDDWKASIRNTEINKLWNLYPDRKFAIFGDDEGSAGNEIGAYDRLKKDFRDGTEKNLGRVKLNGHDTICFEISKDNETITVWADPDTRLPIQIEKISQEKNGIRELLSNIKFDEDLNNQIFVLPSDYSLIDLETQRTYTPFELTEEHLIEGLAVYPKYLDGKFPTRYMGGRPKTEEVLNKCNAEREKHEKWTDEEGDKVNLSCEFIDRLPEGSNYQYVGEDVKLGDANIPVCWWKPSGSKTYRVVYGDLSIRDVEPENLPDIPWLNKN